MLLIIGGGHDAEARLAVDRLLPRRATIMDATDLSQPGWRLFTDAPERGEIVAGGRAVPVSEVTAVLVRRMAVYPQELGHVHPDDRAYVASEMTALLAWWLCTVPVPVFNRSTGAVLCGPGWRPEQWRAQAVRLGFPVAGLRRAGEKSAMQSPIATELVQVGGIILGNKQPPLVECLVELARAAHVPLLYAAFDVDGALITAHTFPRVSEELIEAVEQMAAREFSANAAAAKCAHSAFDRTLLAEGMM